MARRVKPPGKEKWTWDEIEAGRKFSKGDKRVRRLAKLMGATKNPDGSIKPPPVSEKPEYFLVVGGLLILSLIVMVFFPKGCQGH